MHREKSLTLTVAAIALFGLSISAGCSSKPNDAQLVTNIQSQMFADAQLKGASVQVASFGGQVTLKGTVPNDAARYEAYKIVAQTPGVSKVIDQTVVEDPSAQANSIANSAPTTESNATAPLQPAPELVPIKPAPQPKSHERPHPARKLEEVDAAASPQPQTDQVQQAPMPSDVPPMSSSAPPMQSAPPPAPAPPKQYEVAAGTTVTIRMIDSIDSSVNQAGEKFHASLDVPIVVGDDVVVPKGADVEVRLASASSAGKMTGQSQLHLELVKLEFQGQSYPLVSSTYSQVGESRGKDTAKKIGGGAVLGAIIGAVAGGGKGAAIGATVGGGAGGVYQGATHGQQVKIPSETKLDFQLEQPATISVQPQTQTQPAQQPQQNPQQNQNLPQNNE
jgi:hypothetical protein